MNKTQELSASIKLVNDKLHFMGSADKNVPISIDYSAPLGDDLGYTSLELFLLSLSSCLGSSILTLLRKMNKSIEACEVSAKGLRKEEHPTGFRSIHLFIKIKSQNIVEDDMNKVIGLAEDKFCPVLSMIKGNVDIETDFIIER